MARRRVPPPVPVDESPPELVIPRRLFEPPAEFFTKQAARREWLAKHGVRGFLAVNAAERAAIRIHGIDVPDAREWFRQFEVRR